MKYLKKYQIFESIDKDTIKEILLELEDNGFSIEISDKFKIGENELDPSLSSYGNFYNEKRVGKISKDFICIKIRKNKFEWDEVEYYIKNLIDFLENYSEITYKYYAISLYTYHKGGKYMEKLTDAFCNYISRHFNPMEQLEIYFERI